MESKTKHRILGVLVIIGLGILIYPLFQGNDEMPNEQVLVKSPPFPDQSVQVTSTPIIKMDEAIKVQPDDTISPRQSSMVNVKAPEMPKPANPPKPSKPKISAPAKLPPVIRHPKTPAHVAAIQPRKTPYSTAFIMPAHNDRNGLIKLKTAAWVIQMGSFKNKTNALKMVNQLRASGYRAFIQQLPSSDGNNTRVFVGPENKQYLARALASQMENDLHMHGIVISYQPFTL